MSIGVVVITHCAKKHLRHCLPPFLNSPLKPRVLVVNSSSNDGTVELAKELGAETLIIPRNEFNHGTTREKARKYLGTDIVVMVTPDAYAKDVFALEKLISPIVKNEASVSYARQIPHNGANFFESYSRQFNYPEKSQIRGMDDIETHGIYTFFCSNSCAAYSQKALDEIGGFEHVLLGEDTIAVSKLLARGHKIAYVAEAVVRHSHNYTLKQEFRRNFDIGLARSGYRSLLLGSDTTRGIQYTKEMFKILIKTNPLLLPYACMQTFVKWLGYQIGSKSQKAPLSLKKRLSSQDFYWK